MTVTTLVAIASSSGKNRSPCRSLLRVPPKTTTVGVDKAISTVDDCYNLNSARQTTVSSSSLMSMASSAFSSSRPGQRIHSLPPPFAKPRRLYASPCSDFVGLCVVVVVVVQKKKTKPSFYTVCMQAANGKRITRWVSPAGRPAAALPAQRRRCSLTPPPPPSAPPPPPKHETLFLTAPPTAERKRHRNRLRAWADRATWAAAGGRAGRRMGGCTDTTRPRDHDVEAAATVAQAAAEIERRMDGMNGRSEQGRRMRMKKSPAKGGQESWTTGLNVASGKFD